MITRKSEYNMTLDEELGFVLIKTKKIEKLLESLDNTEKGKSSGLYEKLKRANIKDESLKKEIKKIAKIRNKVAHDEEHAFQSKEEFDQFIRSCDLVITKINAYINAENKRLKNKITDLEYGQVELSMQFENCEEQLKLLKNQLKSKEEILEKLANKEIRVSIFWQNFSIILSLIIIIIIMYFKALFITIILTFVLPYLFRKFFIKLIE